MVADQTPDRTEALGRALRERSALEAAAQAAVRAPRTWHVIVERDVGLFSLIQQVIAQVPWALAHRRVPVVAFGSRTIYWQAGIEQQPSSAWEEFFEPVLEGYPVAVLPADLRARIERRPPEPQDVERAFGDCCVASSHFGDHPFMARLAPRVPFETADPDRELRRWTEAIVDGFVRARPDLKQRADRFWQSHLAGGEVIGLHVRGTDAVSAAEQRLYRKGSLRLDRFAAAVDSELLRRPTAKVFVATDATASLDYLRDRFGERVVALDALRHESGEAAGHGPTGCIMPAYMTGSRQAALRNGQDAVVEWLLLRRCQHLIHNGAGMAVTVLLAQPELTHFNTHRPARLG